MNQTNLDFNKATFDSDYSFASPQKLKRDAIDAFSKQFCKTEDAELYSVKYTNGHCFYCDISLYEIVDGFPHFVGIAHDHGTPVAKWGLYTTGNVVISCESCNSAKSDIDPVIFYTILKESGHQVRHASLEVFECDWQNFQKPYAEEWPEHYKLATEGRPDLTVNEILRDYFLFDLIGGKAAIDFTPQNATRNFDGDLNSDIWHTLNNSDHEIFEDMSTHSARDIAGRINHARSIFDEMFGQTPIEGLSEDNFILFGETLIKSRITSANESTKLRSFLKALVSIDGLAKFAVPLQKIRKRKQILESISNRD